MNLLNSDFSINGNQQQMPQNPQQHIQQQHQAQQFFNQNPGSFQGANSGSNNGFIQGQQNSTVGQLQNQTNTLDYPDFTDPQPMLQQQNQNQNQNMAGYPQQQTNVQYSYQQQKMVAPQTVIAPVMASNFGALIDQQMEDGVQPKQPVSVQQTRGESKAPRESRISTYQQQATRRRRFQDRKVIMRDYKKVSSAKKQSKGAPLQVLPRRMEAVSEIGGGSMFHSNADRLLVSGMTSLQIKDNNKVGGKGKKSKRRINGVMSQDYVPVEPVRKMPSRKGKCTDKGTLGAVELLKRVTGALPVAKQQQTMQVDEVNQVNVQAKEDKRKSEIDPKDPYEKIRIDQNANNEDIVCDVCLDDDDDDNNDIVICDLCQVAVHQTCYGGELLEGVPEGNWYCARCKDLIQSPQKKCTEIKCIFCPRIDGVLKPFISGIVGQKSQWAHLICVNWINGVWYSNPKNEAIEGQISPLTMTIACQACKKADQGAVIQCEYQNCTRSLHVRCSVNRGWIYHWNEMMEDLNINNDEQDRPVFCNQHRDRGIQVYKQDGMKGLLREEKSNKVKKPSSVKKPAPLIQMGSPQAMKQIAKLNENKVPKNKRSIVIKKRRSRKSQSKTKTQSRQSKVVANVRRESSVMPLAKRRIARISQTKAAMRKQHIQQAGQQRQRPSRQNMTLSGAKGKINNSKMAIKKTNTKQKPNPIPQQTQSTEDMARMFQMGQLMMNWQQMQQTMQNQQTMKSTSKTQQQQPAIAAKRNASSSRKKSSNRSRPTRNNIQANKLVKTQQQQPNLKVQNQNFAQPNNMQQMNTGAQQYQPQQTPFAQQQQFVGHQQQMQMANLNQGGNIGNGKAFNFQNIY